jgi:hypothetical protein
MEKNVYGQMRNMNVLVRIGIGILHVSMDNGFYGARARIAVILVHILSLEIILLVVLRIQLRGLRAEGIVVLDRP